MARILPKLNFDLGAAGGLLSEIADFKLKADAQDFAETQADRLYEQEVKQTELQESEIDIARKSMQVDLDTTMIEQFGGATHEITKDGVQAKGDIFIDAVHPVTGQKIYDVPTGMQDQVQIGLADVEARYSQLPRDNETLTQKRIAEGNVYRELGLQNKKIIDRSKYPGLSMEMTESGPRLIPLTEKSQEKSVEGSIEVMTAQGKIDMSNWEEKSASERIHEYTKIGMLGEQDLLKLAYESRTRYSELKATQEFQRSMAGEDRDWKTEFSQNEHKWETMERREGETFTKMIKGMDRTWQEWLTNKSFSDSKIIAELDFEYRKELSGMGIESSKELQSERLESAFEVAKYLEEQKMQRDVFKSEEDWARYFQSTHDARLYQKTQLDYVNQLKIGDEERKKLTAATLAVAQLAESDAKVVQPLDLAAWTGDFESKWLGMDEGDWVKEVKNQIIKPAQVYREPLKTLAMASRDKDGKYIPDPYVEQFISNIQELRKTMGDPEAKTGSGVYKINFWNTLDWDAGEALVLYKELMTIEYDMRTARGEKLDITKFQLKD